MVQQFDCECRVPRIVDIREVRGSNGVVVRKYVCSCSVQPDLFGGYDG